MKSTEHIIVTTNLFFTIMIVFFALLLIATSTSYAGTKKLPKKSFTKVVGLTDGGWINTKTYLLGELTYKDSSTKRKFTKENYFMYATSSNDPSLVKRIRISMGILKLHAGGEVYKCKRSGKDTYYADPKWIAHDSATSKTTATGKLKGSSWAELGFAITGDGVVTPRSDTAEWKNIAK